ncbi:hypothetical protein [Bifidobacterium sp. 2450]|uniref:hypothetical protein n=1 Tax=Bifidobacterium sp. 2450 TaxID=3342075 RepID=UPI0035A86B48
MKKYGFLFGAGAEMSYGLPSGGQFALDIFRQDVSEYKQQFRDMRSKVKSTTAYASSELPNNYQNKSVSAFGKSVFENIIKDTIEGNRQLIIKKLTDFDDWAGGIALSTTLSSGDSVNSVLEELLKNNLDNISLSQAVSFNNSLSEGDALFQSKYFSALMLVYHKKRITDDNCRAYLRSILAAILQFQIGALSANLVRDVNDNLFEIKDQDEGSIDIFDDLGEVLHINYASTGIAGMQILFNEVVNAEPETSEELIVIFARKILEYLYSSVLDYKTLIDSNWHYLYSPSNDWAKFTKIVIFLLSVRGYIIKQCEGIDDSIDGYYDQLKRSVDGDDIELSAIATTNYNTFIEKKIGVKVFFLNGSTNNWYDPYLNSLGTKEELDTDEHHILVPLIFTQSGTKPMTSIDMSMIYVDTYKQWLESDALVVVGFGFNRDDEHINGLLRRLIDLEDKKLYVVCIGNTKRNDIAKKLKVRNSNNIDIIRVDKKGHLVEDSSKLWIDKLI